MPVSGEVVDLLERVLADLVNEELDVSSSNEGLASAVEDDRADVIAFVQFVNRLAQLADQGDVERVHRLWPVEADCGDAAVNLDVDVRELERRIPTCEPSGQVQSRFIGIGTGHPDSLGDADAIGYLEGAAGPAQPDLRPAVDVLHRADLLFDDLRGHREGLAKQPLPDSPVGTIVAVGVRTNLPYPALLDQSAQAGCTGEPRAV